MNKTVVAVGALISMFAVNGSARATDEIASVGALVHRAAFDDDAATKKIDPLAFFDALADRYSQLSSYTDVADVVQVTQRRGQEPTVVETRIEIAVEDDELTITTPADQVREGVGLDVPVRKSAAMQKLQMQQDLWMAPHMTLRFSDEPLKEFRLGVDEGFTPTEAHSVKLDDKDMVHLELKSGDGLSEDSTATFDLYIDPESMLIERIEGEQRLPDGADYHTTLEITPLHTENFAPSPEGDAAAAAAAETTTMTTISAATPGPGSDPHDPHADADPHGDGKNAADYASKPSDSTRLLQQLGVIDGG